MHFDFRYITTVCALVAVMLAHVDGGQSSVGDTSAGIQPANQVFAAGDTAEVADSVVFEVSAQSTESVSVGAGGLVDDIALLSGSRVRHCELGLLIRSEEGEQVHVAVLDARGRAVLNKRYSPSGGLISVPTNGFPAGVYVYTVRMTDTVYTNSFMVTK